MKKNQLKAGVFISYISIAVQGLILLLYTPLMLRILGKNEYGTYEMAASVISYLGLLDFGFTSAYVRFYARYKAKEDEEGIARLNGMFLMVFLFLGVITMLAGSILVQNAQMILGGKLTLEEIELARKIMAILVVNVALTLPLGVFDSYIIANEQYFFQRIITLLQTVLNPFLVLILLFAGYRSIVLASVTLFLTIVKLCVNICYCRKRLTMHFVFRHFPFALLKEVFVFSFYIFINMIINQINWNVDKFIIGKITGAAAVAVYSLGAQINQYYLVLSTSISSVFIPRVNKMVTQGEKKEAFTELFTKIGRIQFIVVSFILGGFILLGRFFVILWGGTGYDNAYEVTLWLIVPVTIPLIQNLGIEIQRARNMHKFRSIVYAGIAVINLMISIPLVYRYGEIGAAIGTCIGLLLGNGILMNLYYHKKMQLDMKYFWGQILRIMLPATVAVLCGWGIAQMFPVNSIWHFILVGILYSIIYFVLVGKFGCNDYEKGLVKGPVMKIKNRLWRWGK